MVKRKNKAAVALGRRGGTANTAKQHAARQRNAQRAGRPRRACMHCGAPVVGGHVDRRLDERCGQHGWHWQQGHAGAGPTRVQVQREIQALLHLLATLPPDVVDDAGTFAPGEPLPSPS